MPHFPQLLVESHEDTSMQCKSSLTDDILLFRFVACVGKCAACIGAFVSSISK